MTSTDIAPLATRPLVRVELADLVFTFNHLHCLRRPRARCYTGVWFRMPCAAELGPAEAALHEQRRKAICRLGSDVRRSDCGRRLDVEGHTFKLPGPWR